MKKGYLIIEVLIAVVILAMIMISIFSVFSFVLIKTRNLRYDNEALILMQDGIEVAYNALLSKWNYPNREYKPVFRGGDWALFEDPDPEVLKTRYERTIEVFSACRDTAHEGNLIKIGLGDMCMGEIDENSKIIKVTVSWEEKGKVKEVQDELLVINFGS